jgi:hypothetical protein
MSERVVVVPQQQTPPTGEVPAAQRDLADLPTLPLEVLEPGGGDRVDVTCPSCGTPGTADLDAREASSFCTRCDFPLFWAVERRVAGGVGEGAGLRRLPGSAGRVALARVPCPSCTEPNPPSAQLCLRCGGPMALPEPVTDVEPVPGPPPEPVETQLHWIWSWPGLALIVTLLLAGFTGIVYLTV